LGLAVVLEMIDVEDIETGAIERDAVLFCGGDILRLDAGIVQRELAVDGRATEADLHSVETEFGGQSHGRYIAGQPQVPIRDSDLEGIVGAGGGP
jgi:hypothetical protein